MKTYFNLFIVCAIIIGATTNAQSQCDVSIVPDSIVMTCGDSVSFSAFGFIGGSAQTTDFNAGVIGAGWTSFTNVLFTNPCGPSLDGTPSAWFGNVPMPRTLITNSFDMSCGGQICFDLDFAGIQGSADCESPDELDEGVHLQWSITGGAPWTSLFYFTPDGTNTSTGAYSDWGNYCFILPVGAWSTNTTFRWDQPDGTATTNDHWGIDNVVISPSGCSYTYDWVNVPGVNNDNSQTVSPMTTTTYEVTYTDGVDVCTDSVMVVVNDMIIDITATDTSLCTGACIDLDVLLLNGPATSCGETETATGGDDVTNITWATFPCVPAGASITGITLDASTSGLCDAWSSLDVIVNGTTVAFTLCDTIGLDLTPYLPIDSITVQSVDMDLFIDNITLDATINISYSQSLAYDYLWSPTTDLNSSTIQNPTACPSVNTNYVATLTDLISGCTAKDSITIDVDLNAVPSLAGPVIGSAIVCESATGVTYSVNSVIGATGYTWALPAGAIITGGFGTDSITVDFGTNSGAVSVFPINSCGSGVGDSISVIVNSIDTSVSLVGMAISSNENGAIYQWIDCGNGNSAIGGEASQSYTPVVNGDYAVVVTNNGCVDTSACYNYLLTEVNNANVRNERINIYPNPSSGNILIDLRGNSIKNSSIEIIYLLGKTVYQEKDAQKLTSIDLSGFSRGVYFLNFKNEEGSTVYKIVKK